MYVITSKVQTYSDQTLTRRYNFYFDLCNIAVTLNITVIKTGMKM